MARWLKVREKPLKKSRKLDEALKASKAGVGTIKLKEWGGPRGDRRNLRFLSEPFTHTI